MQQFWISFILIFSFTIVKSDDFPKTNFTKIAGLSEKEWGMAGEIEGKSYRNVLAGKRGGFALANWWGDSIRPPSGSIYVLEILYQDKIKSSAIVSCFSGLGRNLNPTEIHRFGGSGDNLWKIAYIPVSWDLLMLKKDDLLARFYVNNVDIENELPLADLTIRKAILPEDKVRYEAETRDWLKKCFEATSQKIEVPENELTLNEKFKGKAMLPFARPYYDEINKLDYPTIEELEGRVYIRTSLNEYEPGAFGVYAQEELKNVTFKVSDLTNKDGKLNCKIQLSTMEFDAMVKYPKDKTKPKTYYYKADKMWDIYPENLKKGETAWFWITLKTEVGKSKPGTYEGKVSITSGKINEELPIRVDVLPLQLLTMEEAGLWMGGCVSGLVSEQEMITMKEHNHNVINIWASDILPVFNKDKDKLNLGFYYLDDFMNKATKSGQKRIVWFFGGNPPGFPGTLSLERQLYSAFYGKPESEFFKILENPNKRDKIIPEVREIYKNFVKDLVAHGKDNNWPELILTPFDEPVKYSFPSADKGSIGTGLWTREHFKDSCAAIREASPSTKVYISMHHNWERKPFGRVGETFLDSVDIVNTNAIEEDPLLNRKVLDKGKEFWQYSGVRGSGRYSFGFYFGAHESTGSLVWAYNWGKRFNSGGNPEAQYGWCTPFGTISSPEYELFREAWDDRRYLSTYLSLAKKKGIDTKEFMENLKKEILSNLSESTVDKVDEFYVKELNKNKLELIRARLAKKIMELSK